jgi:resorcinol 4-hydroxylase (FADH2)
MSYSPGPESTGEQGSFNPVAIAASLRPLLEEFADRAESESKIPEPVFQAIRESGLLRMMIPRRLGGFGCNTLTHTRTIAELAKGCAGSAWAFGLLSGITGTAASLPQEAVKILFATGDELFCSVSALTGTALPTDGGYLVSGEWGYGSGCMHAHWAMNGVRVVDGKGETVDSAFAIIPLESPGQVEIKNTWQVLGVKASGSNTIVAKDVFVPECLLLKSSQQPPCEALLAQPELEARERIPQEPLFPLGVLSPTLGSAMAMLEYVGGQMEHKKLAGWHYSSKAGSEMFVQQFGEAAMEIDSAWLHVQRAAGMLDEQAQHRVLTGYDKAQIQADCGYAMQLLRRAGERLMDIAGPSGFADTSPLQRHWRDLSFASRHTALHSRLSTELYGRARLGLPSNLMLLETIEPQPSESWAPHI